MRYGIHGGLTRGAENALDDLVASARRAAEHGLDFWSPQMFDFDTLTALAVVAREVPGVHVGTSVVPTYPRHPLMLAGQALTVGAAAPGRFILGIGLSHKMVIADRFGMSFDRPARHMREYLEVLMPTLRGEPLEYDGELYRVNTATAPGGPMKVPGAVPPPVIVAALGEQMLRTAGRLADGTALWMVGPKTLAGHILPTISRAAEEAGRPAPLVALGLPIAVTDDPAGARERVQRTFRFYGGIPSYRAMLDREGAQDPVDIALIGDEDSVTESLGRLEAAGVTHLTMPLAGNEEEQARAFQLLATLAGRSR